MAPDPSLVHEDSPDSSGHYLHSPPRSDSPRVPQIISHRGYKGKFPENTLCAVEKAVEAGTHALELDLHLSRDGEVVLSHDPTLQRCFGVKKKVIDCDWDYLKTLRTVDAPYVPMPRLADVLDYLQQPGRENVWIMLDIKLTNDAATIMRRIAETIESVPMPPGGPEWHRRIALGTWSAHFIPERDQYLPRYAMALITFDLSYARQFLQVPRVFFNVNQAALIGPLGRGFLEEARAAHRAVYVWTVNTTTLMRWSIRHGVDGVLTDYPTHYRQVCEQWESEQQGGAGRSSATKADSLTWGERLRVLVITVLITLFGWIFRRKYLVPVDRVQFEGRKTG